MSVDEQVDEQQERATAFEAFFDLHYRRLAKAAFLMTGDRSEADDVAEEAFVRVFERWGRVSRMASPDGYLYRVAINIVRTRERQRRLHSAVELLPRRTAPDDNVAVEQRGDILRAMALISGTQRSALVLVDWMDLPTSEAARILRIRESTLRVRLHRGRAALRERLGGEYG